MPLSLPLYYQLRRADGSLRRRDNPGQETRLVQIPQIRRIPRPEPLTKEHALDNRTHSQCPTSRESIGLRNPDRCVRQRPIAGEKEQIGRAACRERVWPEE